MIKTVRAVRVLALLAVILVGCRSANMQHLVYLPIVGKSPPMGWLGVGVPYRYDEVLCEDLEKLGIEVFHDWTASPQVCSGIESVPMIWGADMMGHEVKGNSAWLLGFNEPGLEGQANITPTLGAQLWFQIEQKHPGRWLATPSVFILDWLRQWRAAYFSLYGKPPRVDAIAFHCYGSWWPDLAVAQCQKCARDAIVLADEWGIGEVWLTEWAFPPCYPDQDEAGTVEFIERMLPWLRAQPKVTRVFWFALRYEGTEKWAWGRRCNTSLLDFETHQLTEFGKVYR